MGGLTVQGGRLINERPVGMTGIQQSVEFCKAKKRMEKEEMISNAILLAEAKKNFPMF
jgi:hypothetical protein